MEKDPFFKFDADKSNNQIHVEKSFDAPLELIWRAWTEADILDQWWAPKPWVAKTKYMDFREGGRWLYAMVSPENEEHWGRVDYISIDHQKSFVCYDGFCDAEGNINTALPRNKWENNFIQKDEKTQVRIQLTFDSLEDLEKIMEMGFKEGFTAGLENLEQYIKTQIR